MSKQSEVLTPWQSFFDKDYLGSHNFDDNEEKKLTIAGAGKRSVTMPGGKKEDRLVVEFVQVEGQEPVKPMVLNVTNSKAIQKVSGSRHVENWAGTKVTLYVDHAVKFAGKKVDGIRVRVEADTRPQKEQLHEKHTAWSGCVKAIAINNYKVSDIRKKYNVAASTGEKLVEAATAYNLAQ